VTFELIPHNVMEGITDNLSHCSSMSCKMTDTVVEQHDADAAAG